MSNHLTDQLKTSTIIKLLVQNIVSTTSYLVGARNFSGGSAPSLLRWL